MIKIKSLLIGCVVALSILLCGVFAACSSDDDSDNNKKMVLLAMANQNKSSSSSSDNKGTNTGGSSSNTDGAGTNTDGSVDGEHTDEDGDGVDDSTGEVIHSNTGAVVQGGGAGTAGSAGGDVVTSGEGASSSSAVSGMTSGTVSAPAGAPEIVESSGYLNSAYIIFKQVSGATGYEVKVDGTKIDDELIRSYGTYNYNTYDEATSEWKSGSYSNVVRADALGLKAGSHTMSVNAIGSTDTSTVTGMTVIDHDRSGFAFTGTDTPGAYKKDGTLKDGALVIYVTDKNKAKVKASLTDTKGKATEYTGVAAITQAIKSRKISTKAVDIRIVGQINGYKDIQCNDMASAYAIGVKEASNVTIEGVGHDATLQGAGVAAFTCKNIEIANLGLVEWGGGNDGDGISLKQSEYVWVHNNDYFYGEAGSDADQVKGDGSMDLKDDSKCVTIAYNHFWDSGKMSLCGMKSESGPNLITYHHNWFDHSDSRHPRIRKMSVHVYNNYFDGNAKYGVGVAYGGSAFVENNYYRNPHDPMLTSMQGTDKMGAGTFSSEDGGVIKSWNNQFAEVGTNGVKLQFITNKYNYTTGEALGERVEHNETVGTKNADGTWTIYEAKVTDADDGFAKCSFISTEDATKKGAYYQASKEKTALALQVPKNTTKVIITAKCGSSSATSCDFTFNGVKQSASKTGYKDFEFSVSGLSGDSVLKLVNSDKSSSLNVSGVKVIAATGWATTYYTGADISNIDAYEVDSRDEKVPDSVVAAKGGTKYDNANLSQGDAKLGLTKVPSNPTVAKSDVVKYSGRSKCDLVWQFNNAADDASYALNTALSTKIVAYKTGVTKIQGDN